MATLSGDLRGVVTYIEWYVESILLCSFARFFLSCFLLVGSGCAIVVVKPFILGGIF